jgi:protein-L-isoaspartate(D-aspartate) O-methyltransferase
MNHPADEYRLKREQMVSGQIVRRGVKNQRVLDAMRSVPRHLFVNPEMLDFAYAAYPLPIGYEQTISQPYIVGLMTSLLDLKGNEKVLEIGTGSGYQAAVLSLLAQEVHTIELISPLASHAEALLKQLGYFNVKVHLSDGSLGWQEDAPYDAVLVTASAPRVPPPLLQQLLPTGKLVIPVGWQGYQTLELWTQEHGVWQSEEFLPVAFVPLHGVHGWKGEDI